MNLLNWCIKCSDGSLAVNINREMARKIRQILCNSMEKDMHCGNWDAVKATAEMLDKLDRELKKEEVRNNETV